MLRSVFLCLLFVGLGRFYFIFAADDWLASTAEIEASAAEASFDSGESVVDAGSALPAEWETLGNQDSLDTAVEPQNAIPENTIPVLPSTPNAVPSVSTSTFTSGSSSILENPGYVMGGGGVLAATLGTWKLFDSLRKMVKYKALNEKNKLQAAQETAQGLASSALMNTGVSYPLLQNVYPQDVLSGQKDVLSGQNPLGREQHRASVAAENIEQHLPRSQPRVQRKPSAVEP
jgi:hypothetical protein